MPEYTGFSEHTQHSVTYCEKLVDFGLTWMALGL
jgi:hypothetical protein